MLNFDAPARDGQASSVLRKFSRDCGDSPHEPPPPTRRRAVAHGRAIAVYTRMRRLAALVFVVTVVADVEAGLGHAIASAAVPWADLHRGEPTGKAG